MEKYLVAVVSLPAGVFNPYSGVKTSILILDPALAKRADHIAFFKIENDGFDKGAQRRPIAQDDLPQALNDVTEFLRRLRVGETLEGWVPSQGLIVPKERLAADGSYDLRGDQYRAITIQQTDWPMVELGVVADIFNGITSRKSDYQDSGLVKVMKVKDFDEIDVYFDKNERGWINYRITTHKYLQVGDSLMINAAHNASHVASKIGFLNRQPPFKSLPSASLRYSGRLKEYILFS